MWWPSIEVTSRAIASTALESWPGHRREALAALAQAAVDHFIASGSYDAIDRWLCAIALMKMDVQPHLARIERRAAAVLRYFEDNCRCLKDGKLCNPFWELPNEGHDAIVQWFKSDLIRKIQFEAYGYVM